MKVGTSTASIIAIVLCLTGSISASTLYVDDDAPAGGDGLSWETAFNDLQDALAAAAASGGTVDEIRVAGGRYTPAPLDGPRDATFDLVSGVAVRGGYAGHGAADPDERNIRVHETILTGDLLDDDTADAGFEDNAYHVVTSIGTDAATELEGLIITGGRADGPEPRDRGAGVYNDNGNLVLRRCAVTDNRAWAGGGMRNENGASPLITNCLFTRNIADPWAGGAINSHNSTPTLVNCTIADNHALSAAHGGGLMNPGSTEITLTNCICWGNLADGSAHESAQIGNGTITIDYCCVQGWTGTHGGIGNIGDDPRFAFADDFHLTTTSPCVDTGTNTPSAGLPAHDKDGNPRPLDGDGDAEAIADMGIYEFNADAPSIALTPTTFVFTALEGGVDPPDQMLSLRNCGGQTLHWEITGQTAWLTVLPSTGESDGEVDQVTLSTDVTGLTEGLYSGQLQITDPQAINSPRAVVVALPVRSELRVPDEFPTIQAAIDAAPDGSVVEVADGTYTGEGNKDLDFGGKAITVRSTSGDPALCVIDCEGDGRGFIFENGEGSDSVVDGLTITSGNADDSGGGVYCSGNSSPKLIDCVIRANSGGFYGGGVFCDDHSNPTLIHCTIGENSSAFGGGVYFEESTSPTLVNCTINANLAARGGGLYCGDNTSPALINCTISGNVADIDGGGIRCDYSSPSLTNCTISGNSAPHGSGMDCIGDGSPVLTNCTMSGNRASSGSGGGIHCDGSNPTLVNCILWGDAPDEIALDSGTLIVAYCNVHGSWPGEGNIDADPLFIDPDGPDDDPTTWEDNDYRVGQRSPCIDAADNTAVPADEFDLDGNGDSEEPLPIDRDGLPRFIDDAYTPDTGVGTPPIVDMGAYEFQGQSDGTLLVPSHYGTIQAAIDAALNGDVVEIADGTYTGAGNKDLNFLGKAITARSASGNPNLCIIDCENAGSGFIFENGEGSDSFVEGLTITNAEDSLIGAGIRCSASSPTVTNCTITGTVGSSLGGGVYCESGSEATFTHCMITGNTARWGGGVSCSVSNPTFLHCTISGNRADEEGGGVHCGGSDSGPTLTHCDISDNWAGEKGGGVYCYGSSPTLTDCTINNNRAVVGGGLWCRVNANPTLIKCRIRENRACNGAGVWSGTSSSSVLTSCVISGNAAFLDGGAVYCQNYSTPTLTNCTITGNSALRDSGALYCEDSTPTFTNCILWSNSPREIDNQGSVPVLTYSDVQGGWPGEGNIDVDPQFALADDVHLASGSPCIDAGSNEPAGGLPSEDADGNPRPLDGDEDTIAVADMGVYEYNPGAPSIALSSAEFAFFAPEDGDNPADQMLSVRNCGGGTLSWEITGQPDWLTVTPSAGESNEMVDEVALSVDVSGLAYGAYPALLEVADPQAVNSPREIAVTLYVTTTVRVPAEFPTIQAAIDATEVSGDVVEIADGTYAGPGNKGLDFGGKAITVRSESGDPGQCIVDCEGDGRGFEFHSAEGPASIVEGLTITNGDVQYGGGVYCREGSDPTLINCAISGNAAAAGGGVCSESLSRPTLTHCTVTGNTTTWGDGGGILCRLRGNPTLTGCLISGNSTVESGGAVACDAQSSPTVTNCMITANSAAHRGGAVYCYNYGNPRLTHCTISGNTTADGECGGVYGAWYSNITLTNCTLWGDTQPEFCADSGEHVVSYCNVQGGWPGEGNIDADPLFAFHDDFHLVPGSPCIDAGTNDPPGGLPADDADDNPRPLDGDDDAIAVADIGVYEFNPGAPSIAMSPAAFEFFAPVGGDHPADQVLSLRNCGGGTLNWEITGQPAWLVVTPPAGQSDETVDEVSLSVDATGLTYGTYSAVLVVSDPQAVNSPREVAVILYVTRTLHVPGEYATIQSAINASQVNGDIVAIADGTYTGEGNKDLNLHGKVITVRSASGDPALCAIDCEGSGRGFNIRNGEGLDSIVEGLTITNGRAAGDGGGIRCVDSSPTIMNCRIIWNETSSHGGGVHCDDGAPTLIYCMIEGNVASGFGGGIDCTGYSRPTIVDCTFAGNSGEHGGGVSSRSGGTLSFIRCTISDNLAEVGGGVYCNDSSPTITNCLITRNVADFGGGAYCWAYSHPRITHCTIHGNTSLHQGGGVSIHHGHPTLTNCILWGDTPEEIYVDSSDPIVSYCDVQGGWPGTGNIDADPLFVAGSGGCFYLSQTAAGLPYDSPCVDAGSDTAEYSGLDEMTTRRDESGDTGMVDLGYHYPVTGQSYLPGDIDGDGDRDLNDYVLFAPALTGPGPWPSGTITGCPTAGDLNDDGDIDLGDFAAFQWLFAP